jgi:hypothetical protein
MAESLALMPLNRNESCWLVRLPEIHALLSQVKRPFRTAMPIFIPYRMDLANGHELLETPAPVKLPQPS